MMTVLVLLAYVLLGPLLCLLQTREGLRRDGRREATRHSFFRQLLQQPPQGMPKQLVAAIANAGGLSTAECQELAASCSLKVRQWLLASHARRVCGGQVRDRSFQSARLGLPML